MVGKSSVSALQEYCAKNQIASPTYDFIDSDEGNGSFVCRVYVLSMSADGNGRSKRDAKHQAAAQVIKKLRVEYPDIDEIPQMQMPDEMPTTDMIVMLRDYCVQHQHPLPTIEIVQQAGTPDAPEFTALCTLASLRRYGISEKKKDARQLAALEMMRVIIDDDKLEHHMQLATLQAKSDDVESERYRKFKTYRELTESNLGEMPGILLCDRHNFFTRFYDHLKTEARTVLSTAYDSPQAQAKEVMRALRLKPKITPMAAAAKTERMLYIELDCDYDVAFAGLESVVYQGVVDYFRDML